MLGADEVQSLPPRLGSGFVDTAHGKFPVPAPATLELLKGVPVESGGEPVELVTPTGAALLAEFCSQFGAMPAMSIEKIGYGAGTRDLEKTPKVLRGIVGEASSETGDTIAVIETKYGEIEVKVGRLAGKVVSRSPEYESCKQAAAKAGVAVKDVYTAAARPAEEII